MACRRAVVKYREQLTNVESFEAWTLESVISALEATAEGAWVAELRRRYVGERP